MKIVINRCYGGFGLSYKAIMRYAEIKNIQIYAFLHIGRNKMEPYDSVLSPIALIHYSIAPLNEKQEINDKDYFDPDDLDRTDPILIQVVEELGAEANGSGSKLKIVEIPDGVDWDIDEFDGKEKAYEKHRVWY